MKGHTCCDLCQTNTRDVVRRGEVEEPHRDVLIDTTEENVGADLPPLLPARMLNEFTYCPRLFYLEWVQGEFKESADTLDGHRTHRRVEKEGGNLPAPDEWTEGLKVKARAVSLSSERAGLTAKLDLLEDDGGKVCPVDYKRGHGPENGAAIWDADRIQVGVQMLLLRDSGYPCDRGYVYYAEAKQRTPLDCSSDLERNVLGVATLARETAAWARIPAPLVDSPKCPRCSLVGICLPDEVRLLALDPGARRQVDVRPLLPARDDALPLYVQAQGAMVAKNGDLLEVRQKNKTVASARLGEVSQVCLLGSVMLTARALHELCERGVPVCHFSYGGWFYGITHGLAHKNVGLRLSQFRVHEGTAQSLAIARGMIEGKVRNCRTLLRRNHPGGFDAPLEELARLTDLVGGAESAEALLALEGAAAKTYFACYGGLLKTEEGAVSGFDFNGRNRRPPSDPVNAMLSFLYAILTKDTTVTLQAVGFDPMLGFFHRPRYGRPSLALDLMEEFRPLVVDSTVVTLVNNKEVVPSDFVRRGGSVAMSSDGRKKVLSAYERRMSSEVTHPIFGYRISLRRVV